MLCIMALGACQQSGSGSGSGDNIDTTEILKAFLIDQGIVDKVAFDVTPETMGLHNTTTLTENELLIAQLKMMLKQPDWKSAGKLVTIADAKEQINTYLGKPDSRLLRSFTIDKNVFKHYMDSTADTLSQFKLYIAVARDTNTRELLPDYRSMFVVGISKRGHLISLKNEAEEDCYYDQISPCPADCPPNLNMHGRSHCDYIDSTKCEY